MDRRDDMVVIVRVVSLPCDHDLAAVAQALDTLGFRLGPGQRRQKHGRQNGDDGDNYQEFNQCERTGRPARHTAGCILWVMYHKLCFRKPNCARQPGNVIDYNS